MCISSFSIHSCVVEIRLPRTRLLARIPLLSQSQSALTGSCPLKKTVVGEGKSDIGAYRIHNPPPSTFTEPKFLIFHGMKNLKWVEEIFCSSLKMPLSFTFGIQCIAHLLISFNFELN